MSTQISSRWTAFYKFFVPLMVVGGLGAGAYMSWLHPDKQKLPPGMPPDYGWVIFVITGALVCVILWFVVGRLKQVELDGDELIISNFREEIRVPLANVEKISGRSLSDPPRYTITFVDDTEFGRRVTFLGPRRWGWVKRFSDSDEIVELRRAWEAARSISDRR